MNSYIQIIFHKTILIMIDIRLIAQVYTSAYPMSMIVCIINITLTCCLSLFYHFAITSASTT